MPFFRASIRSEASGPREAFLEHLGPMRLLGEGLQVGRLGSRHRLIAGHPVLGVFHGVVDRRATSLVWRGCLTDFPALFILAASRTCWRKQDHAHHDIERELIIADAQLVIRRTRIADRLEVTTSVAGGSDRRAASLDRQERRAGATAARDPAVRCHRGAHAGQGRDGSAVLLEALCNLQRGLAERTQFQHALFWQSIACVAR